MAVEKIAKQIIDFQRTTFDNSFNAVVMLQDQAERLFNTAMKQATWVPQEGRQVLDEWIRMYKMGRKDFRHLVDDNFDKLSDFFKNPETFSAKPEARDPKPVKTAN